jgi:predicted histidine transporter YuiF (NhaC family)
MDRRLIACMITLGLKFITFVANATSQTQMPVEIRLLTDIVIPPQVAFEVRIESNAGVYGTGAVVCALSGYGKIFSAGSSF